MFHYWVNLDILNYWFALFWRLVYTDHHGTERSLIIPTEFQNYWLIHCLIESIAIWDRKTLYGLLICPHTLFMTSTCPVLQITWLSMSVHSTWIIISITFQLFPKTLSDKFQFHMVCMCPEEQCSCAFRFPGEIWPKYIHNKHPAVCQVFRPVFTTCGRKSSIFSSRKCFFTHICTIQFRCFSKIECNASLKTKRPEPGPDLTRLKWCTCKTNTLKLRHSAGMETRALTLVSDDPTLPSFMRCGLITVVHMTES